MPLGIFAKLLATNLKFVQLHFRIPTKQHPGEIAMYRYLSCLIVLVATTTALAQNPILRQDNSCPTGTYKSGDYCKPYKSNSDQVIIEKSVSVGRSTPLLVRHIPWHEFFYIGHVCTR
jgi:hypothetical protein